MQFPFGYWYLFSQRILTILWRHNKFTLNSCQWHNAFFYSFAAAVDASISLHSYALTSHKSHSCWWNTSSFTQEPTMPQLPLPIIPRQPRLAVSPQSYSAPLVPQHHEPTQLWPSASLLQRVPLPLVRQHTRSPLQIAQERKCLANKRCLFDNTEHYLQTVAPFNQHICPWFQDVIVAHFKSAT